MTHLKEFARDPYFKIDVECHVAPNIFKQMGYYGLYGSENRTYGLSRILGDERAGLPAAPPFEERDATPEATIALMDKYGIDMALVAREDVRMYSQGVTPACTNQYILDAYEKYPDRFIFAANPTPILTRKMAHVLWELEFLVRENNCRAVSEFGVDEEAYINDRRYWPFYAKVSELGIPIVIHTGMNWVRGVARSITIPNCLRILPPNSRG